MHLPRSTLQGVSPMRTFDPVVLGRAETAAWAGYYRREWGRVLRAFLTLVGEGFGLRGLPLLRGAWLVLRANRAWSPYPDNDPARAQALMERFYALVGRRHGTPVDPGRAAELEVAWWRVHRELQHGAGEIGREAYVAPLAAALQELYAYVYAVDPAAVEQAARWRAEAMDVSDRWVRAGARADDVALAREEELLVSAYASLRAAVGG